MSVNKVEVNGETVLDLSQDSVTPEQLAQGATAHNAAGEQITGTYTAPVTSVNGQTGDVEVKAVLYEQQTLTKTQQGQARSNIVAAQKAVLTIFTLLATKWVSAPSNDPYGCKAYYRVVQSGVTAVSVQEIIPGAPISAEQLAALQAANIQDGGQEEGAFTLAAYGDIPKIDLPIRIILRGD